MRDHDNDLQDGVFIAHQPLDWTEALRETERLGETHTEAKGFRALYLLHAGAARILLCEEFYSFDLDARTLASLAGLKVLPSRP